MRELAALTFQTLDGVMQAPSMPGEDTSGGFDRGGWAAPFWPEVMAQVQSEAMAQPYDILFGRKTYETFADHWPSAEDNPVSRLMNSARKYVVTSTLADLSWHNSVPLAGELTEVVANLKAEDGPLLQVHGSWALLQGLLENDLIDEFRLWTFPVAVGAGKRLFQNAVPPGDLSLVKTATTAQGVVMTIYRRG